MGRSYSFSQNCSLDPKSVHNIGIGAVCSHMEGPSSQKVSKHSKNMKVLSSIKIDAFTHLVIPKNLSKSATSKETAGVQNVAEVSSCSTSHSNCGISKITI